MNRYEKYRFSIYVLLTPIIDDILRIYLRKSLSNYHLLAISNRNSNLRGPLSDGISDIRISHHLRNIRTSLNVD